MRTYAKNVSDSPASTGPVGSTAAASRPNQHANPFLSLQRTVGNRMVQRWLRARAGEPEAEPADGSPARTPGPNSPPPSTLQRQSNTNNTAPAPSVDPARFRALAAQAVGRLSGRLVSAETAAPVVQPILQAMVANAVWCDAAGREQGGGYVSYTVPGNPPSTVMLRAVFDDRPLVPDVPLPEGKFHPEDGPSPGTPRGTPRGTLVLYVRRLASANNLTSLLFHESLHMVAWLLRLHRGASHLGGTRRGAPWMAALDITRNADQSQLGWLRVELLELADHVDRLRRRSGAPPVDRRVLVPERLPSYLLEEVRVQTETAIFGELASIDANSDMGAGRAVINRGVLERYIFDFYLTHLRGHHPDAFRPDDRPLVEGDPAATQMLTTFAATLDAMLEQRVRARTAGRQRVPARPERNTYVRPPFPPPLPQPNYNPPRGGSVFDGPNAPSSSGRPRRGPGRGRQPQRPDAGVQPGGAVRLEHVVDFVVIQGSERNPHEDLAFANRVFADCGVHFTAGAYHTIPAAEALNFVGFSENMHVSEDDCPVGSVSRDTERLFNYAQTAFGLRARLRAFYVPSHDGRGHGFSFFPECTRGPAARFRGHLVIRNGAPPRTLAHELGHILLDSGLHSGFVDSGDTDNLMVPSELSTDSLLDRAQCNVVNGSTRT